MLTAEQLAIRRTGIGGSDVAAVLGESEFAGPFDVWLSKREGWERPPTPDTERGTHLEAGIAEWYCARTGAQRWAASYSTERHAIKPWALCTPDLLVCANETHRRVVSIKAPRRRTSAWGEAGSAVVPTGYALQLQWEWAVMSSRLGELDAEMHLAALLDGDLLVYRIHADVELQTWLLEYVERWWQAHVVEGAPPPHDGSTQAKRWLARRHPQDSGEQRAARGREVALMVELELAEREAEVREQEAESLRLELRMLMGETTRLDASNGWVTWKTDKRGQKTFRTNWRTK